MWLTDIICTHRTCRVAHHSYNLSLIDLAASDCSCVCSSLVGPPGYLLPGSCDVHLVLSPSPFLLMSGGVGGIARCALASCWTLGVILMSRRVRLSTLWLIYRWSPSGPSRMALPPRGGRLSSPIMPNVMLKFTCGWAGRLKHALLLAPYLHHGPRYIILHNLSPDIFTHEITILVCMDLSLLCTTLWFLHSFWFLYT